MKIKVCGMKNPENIRQLVALPIDMLGLIFYEKSPRFAGNLDPEVLNIVPENIKKVGVFVNTSKDYILETAKKYGLDILQLHGTESPEFCEELRENGYIIIKAFSIADANDLNKCKKYTYSCDYFLFDTKTPLFGGSGQRFDWQILREYKLPKPYFLSGGIGEEELKIFTKSSGEDFVLPFALDLNSRFELDHGLKDIEMLRKNLENF
ncbi:MAG: phosphoribosylanthranilate isomerase [Dysgonamonadaceae bacterium]|jgi:phosphoribosylanthranilate isomerase|nr:phosphoribosylanthranilate isomerase [Dysgonamonadaceae bacterium]